MTSPQAGGKRVVLLPVDSSHHCEIAFKWYLANSMKKDDTLVLLHVVQPSFSIQPGGIAIESQFAGEVQRSLRTGKKVLEHYAKMCKDAALPHSATLHADSSLGHAVVTAAAEHNVSLIVMSSRGEGKMRRTTLGSVSHYTIHHSHVPVLVVPAANRRTVSFSAEFDDTEKL